MSRACIRTLAFACFLPSLEAARSVTSATLEVEDGTVCSVEEEPQHVQYGVQFSVDFPGGCNKVKCGKYFFSTVLPKMMLARHEDSLCKCFGTGIMSKTGEPVPLFNYRAKTSKTLETSCTPEECWRRYSKAMYLAKKVDNPLLEQQQALARPEHWTLQCIDRQLASNTGLPTLVEVAAELNQMGGKYADAVQDIIQEASIVILEDNDATKGLSQNTVIQSEGEPSSPIDNYTPWAETPASAPVTLEEVGSPASLDGLVSAPMDDSVDGLASAPINDSVDGLASAPVDDSVDVLASTFVDDSVDELASAPNDDSVDGLASTPVDDSVDELASAPIDDSVDGLASIPVDDSVDELASAPINDSVDGLASTPVDDSVDELASAPVDDSLEGLGSAPVELPDLKHPAPKEDEEDEEDPRNTAKCDAIKDEVSYAVCMCGLANKLASGKQLGDQCRQLSLSVKQRTTYWTCSVTRSSGKKTCVAKMQLSR